jgi:hypothetical protein
MSRHWTSIKGKWKRSVHQVGCVYYVIISLGLMTNIYWQHEPVVIYITLDSTQLKVMLLQDDNQITAQTRRCHSPSCAEPTALLRFMQQQTTSPIPSRIKQVKNLPLRFFKTNFNVILIHLLSMCISYTSHCAVFSYHFNVLQFVTLYKSNWWDAHTINFQIMHMLENIYVKTQQMPNSSWNLSVMYGSS